MTKVNHWINQGLIKELKQKTTVNKENKSRSISTTSLSGKSTKIEKPSEIDIRNEDLSISVLYGNRESVSSVNSYQQCTPSKKIKIKFRHFDNRKRNYSRSSQPK